MNNAINFLLDMNKYNIEVNMTENNPHIKIDIDMYQN